MTPEVRKVKEIINGIRVEETSTGADSDGRPIMASIFRPITTDEKDRLFEEVIERYLDRFGTAPIATKDKISGELVSKRYVDVIRFMRSIVNDDNISYDDAISLFEAMNNLIAKFRNKYEFVNYDKSLLRTPEKLIDELFIKKVLDTAKTYRISKPSSYGDNILTLSEALYSAGYEDTANKVKTPEDVKIIRKLAVNAINAGDAKLCCEQKGRSLSFYTEIGINVKTSIKEGEDSPVTEFNYTTKGNKVKVELGYVANVTRIQDGFSLGSYDSTGTAKQGFQYEVTKDGDSFKSNIDELFNAFTNHADPTTIELQDILLSLFNDKVTNGAYSEENLNRLMNNSIIKRLLDTNKYIGKLVENPANPKKFYRAAVDKEQLADDILAIRYHTSEETENYGDRQTLVNATDGEIQESVNEWKARLYDDFAQTYYIQSELSAGRSPEIKMATNITVSYDIDNTKPTRVNKDFMDIQTKWMKGFNNDNPVLIYSVNADSEGVDNYMKEEGNRSNGYNHVDFGIGDKGLLGMRVGIKLGSYSQDGVDRPIVVYLDRGNRVYDPDNTHIPPIRQLIEDELKAILKKKAIGLLDADQTYNKLNALIGKTGLVNGLHVHRSGDRIWISNKENEPIVNIYSSVVTADGVKPSRQMIISYTDSDKVDQRFYLQPDEGKQGFVPEASRDKDMLTYLDSSVDALVKLLLTGEHNGNRVGAYNGEGVRFNLNFAMLSNEYKSGNMYVTRGNNDKGITFNFEETGKTLSYNSTLDYIVDNEAFSTNFQVTEGTYSVNGRLTKVKSAIHLNERQIGSEYGKGIYIRLPENAPKRHKPIGAGRMNRKNWGDKLSVDGEGDNNLVTFMSTPVEEGGLGLTEPSVNTLLGDESKGLPRLIPDEVVLDGDRNNKNTFGLTGYYDVKNRKIHITRLGVSQSQYLGAAEFLRNMLHEGLHQKLDIKKLHGETKERIIKNSNDIINTFYQAVKYLDENDTKTVGSDTRHLVNALRNTETYFATLDKAVEESRKNALSRLKERFDKGELTEDKYKKRVEDTNKMFDDMLSDKFTEDEKKAVLAEEIIIESTTDRNLAAFLNSIDYNGEIDAEYLSKGRETLFQKIVKHILKFFNIELNDSSILAKELELLAKDVTKIEDKEKELERKPDEDNGIRLGEIPESKVDEFKKTFEDVKQSENFKESHEYEVAGEKVTTSVTQKLSGKPKDNKESDTPLKIISTSVGNSVDRLGRNYFDKNNGPRDNGLGRDYGTDPIFTDENIERLISKNIGEGAFEDLRTHIFNMVKNANGGVDTGFRIITTEIPIAAKWTKKGTTESEVVAGTMDMLVIDANGNYYIIDFKTKGGFDGELGNLDKSAYFAQVNHYRMMVEANKPELRGKFKGLALAVFSISKYSDNINYEKGPNDTVTVDGVDIKGDLGKSPFINTFIDSNDKSTSVGFIDIPINDASEYDIAPYDRKPAPPEEPVREEAEAKPIPADVSGEQVKPTASQESDILRQARENVSGSRRGGRNRRSRGSIPRAVVDDTDVPKTIGVEDNVDRFKRNPKLNVDGMRRTFDMNNFGAGLPTDAKLVLADAMNKGVFNFFCV